MATVKQYALNLWRVHKTITAKLGISVEWGSSETRALVLSNDIMLSGFAKLLVDKGLVTDQELTAVFTTITNANFPPLPVVIPASEDGVSAPDPDLG